MWHWQAGGGGSYSFHDQVLSDQCWGQLQYSVCHDHVTVVTSAWQNWVHQGWINDWAARVLVMQQLLQLVLVMTLWTIISDNAASNKKLSAEKTASDTQSLLRRYRRLEIRDTELWSCLTGNSWEWQDNILMWPLLYTWWHPPSGLRRLSVGHWRSLHYCHSLLMSGCHSCHSLHTGNVCHCRGCLVSPTLSTDGPRVSLRPSFSVSPCPGPARPARPGPGLARGKQCTVEL